MIVLGRYSECNLLNHNLYLVVRGTLKYDIKHQFWFSRME